MATYQLISSVTVGSGGASSIDFTSIPATYTDLVVKVSARSTGAVDYQFSRVRFNSDTGSNYADIRIYGDGTSALSAKETTDTSGYFMISGNNNTANTFGNTDIYIPNYTGSNYKSFSVDAVTENNATGAYALLFVNIWKSTSAITGISLLPTTNNFAQHSTAYLYGIKNS